MIFSSLTKSKSSSSYRRDFVERKVEEDVANVSIESYKENTKITNENLEKPFKQLDDKVNLALNELSKRGIL